MTEVNRVSAKLAGQVAHTSGGRSLLSVFSSSRAAARLFHASATGRPPPITTLASANSA